jgi:hypothetical protein
MLDASKRFNLILEIGWNRRPCGAAPWPSAATSKSGSGLSHVKTQARPRRLPNRAPRPGMRWPSSAFEREPENSATYLITPMVATSLPWPAAICNDLR